MGGLSASGFRPSDDVCSYPFHIPSNMFAVASLTSLVNMLETIDHQERCFFSSSSSFSSSFKPLLDALRQEADLLRHEIDAGIQAQAIHSHPVFGEMYCYEVDGLGNCLLMDDANNPSLLGIPHYGYSPLIDDHLHGRKVYANTRAFVLSNENPYFVTFSKEHQKPLVSGAIGSPHTPPQSVWPMSLIIQATTRLSLLAEELEPFADQIESDFAQGNSNLLRSESREHWHTQLSLAHQEVTHLFELLHETTAGSGLMHESFSGSPFHPDRFTRSWFAWANSLFAESVLSSLPLFC